LLAPLHIKPFPIPKLPIVVPCRLAKPIVGNDVRSCFYNHTLRHHHHRNLVQLNVIVQQ
jgi:hypothetical protein